jgi:hypothetical protein
MPYHQLAAFSVSALNLVIADAVEKAGRMM